MATSSYVDKIQQLYIAYFGRPADPAGLAYWTRQADSQGGDLSGIIAGFSASAESTALYGSMSTEQTISAIYANLFKRGTDAAGLAYWKQQLDSGAVTQAQAAHIILLGAQGSDITAVNNKLTAANAFTSSLDTTAEQAGYNGVTALASGRTFLNRIDASEASLVNLQAAVAAAVEQATGTGTPAPAPVVFSVIQGDGNALTFVNQGSKVAVSLKDGTYTFTSNGDHAGTATVTGSIASIGVPIGTTLSIGSMAAGNLKFLGTGTVALTDTGVVKASVLKTLEANTSGLLDATKISTISEASVADARLLLLDKGGLEGDAILRSDKVNVILTDTTAIGGDLRILHLLTNGVIDARTVSTITFGGGINIQDMKDILTYDPVTFLRAPDVKVVLTGEVNTTDLITIDKVTSGLVDAQGVSQIAGTIVEVKQIIGAGSAAIAYAGNVKIELKDTTASATDLLAIDNASTGVLNVPFVRTITDATVTQARQLLVDDPGHFGRAGNVNVELNDIAASAADLNLLDVMIGGKITAIQLSSVSGSLAEVKTTLEAITSSLADPVNASLVAAKLNSVTLTDKITATALDQVTLANNTTLKLADVSGNTLTLADKTLGAGKVLTLDASAVTSAVTLNGQAETDGTLTFIGGSGADTLSGGAKADILTGGAGVDNFVFGATNHSTLAALDTITDYRGAGINAGANDTIILSDIATVISNQNKVQDLSGQTDLTAALNSAANAATTDKGLSVFLYKGDTYVYVETTGTTTHYVVGDTVIKLSGTPFMVDANLAGLGIDGL